MSELDEYNNVLSVVSRLATTGSFITPMLPTHIRVVFDVNNSTNFIHKPTEDFYHCALSCVEYSRSLESNIAILDSAAKSVTRVAAQQRKHTAENFTFEPVVETLRIPTAATTPHINVDQPDQSSTLLERVRSGNLTMQEAFNIAVGNVRRRREDRDGT